VDQYVLVGWAGLKESYLDGRVLAQTGCEYAACRAGADDEVVKHEKF
jgi:hypothetical protein